ncbi:MAG: dTDP-4-dehydrorhamnose reductase [Gammaproteobacteria bacterium]|nr:dTDP-4-dehydrorhamnose reductase [Gammaproteobacteria bacterium]
MPGSILIAGAGGQVGHELANADSLHQLIALSRAQLDISDSSQLIAAIGQHRPDIVINAAAYTQVDRAEEDRDNAFAINRDGVANLARACKQASIPLLHISTDYVFSGDGAGAYREDDEIAPRSVYGASKAAGEAELRSLLDRHINLRTSWVFSATGGNFVKTMLRLGKERDELGIVDDQHGCPTSARRIAGVLLTIADSYLRGDDIEWGTYHFCSQPDTTWFRFAREIFRLAGGYENLRLNAITTGEYPTPAARPMNSVLDCSKLKASFGYSQPGWVDELRLVLKELGING